MLKHQLFYVERNSPSGQRWPANNGRRLKVAAAEHNCAEAKSLGLWRCSAVERWLATGGRAHNGALTATWAVALRKVDLSIIDSSLTRSAEANSRRRSRIFDDCLVERAAVLSRTDAVRSLGHVTSPRPGFHRRRRTARVKLTVGQWRRPRVAHRTAAWFQSKMPRSMCLHGCEFDARRFCPTLSSRLRGSSEITVANSFLFSCNLK